MKNKITCRPSEHCWQDYQDYDIGASFTCLLQDEHEGEHIWTNDDDITVELSN